MKWNLLFEIELIITVGVIISLVWYCWVCFLWHNHSKKGRKRKNYYYSATFEDDFETWASSQHFNYLDN